MSADESAMNTSLLSTNSEQELVSPVKKRVVARVGGRALQTTPSRRSVRFADDTLDGDESDDSRGRHSSGSSRSSSPTITVGASGARGGSRGGVHRLQSRGDSAAMLTTDSETDGGAATPAATDTPTRRAGGSLADMFRPAGSQLKGAPAPLAPATLAAAPASAVALGAAAVPAASVAQDSSSSTGLRGAGLPGPAAAAPAGAGGAGALKYRTINERAAVASVAASPSRPDAPNVEDMLRRISVVLLQHMHRGERAAVGGLGLDSGASSSAASNGTGNAAGGAGAGGLAPGVSGSPVLASTAARVRAASMAADAAADSLLGAGDSPAAGSGSAGAGASACEAAASCPSLIGCCGIGSATGLGAFQGPSFHASLTAASSPAYATVASIARTLVSPNGWLRLLGVGAWCGVTGGSIFDCGGSGKSSSSSDGSGSSGGAAMGSSWGTGWCGLGSRPPLCCRSGKGKGEDEEDEGADALVGAGKAPPKGEWDTTSSEDEYAGPRARAATTSSTGTAASRAGGGRASGVAAGAAPSSSSSDPKPRPPPTLEEIYDDEVEGDEFHEARFLRPQYAVLHTDPGFNGFFGGGASTIIVKQRYAFSMPSSSDIYDFMLRLFKRVSGKGGSGGAAAAAIAVSPFPSFRPHTSPS